VRFDCSRAIKTQEVAKNKANEPIRQESESVVFYLSLR